MKNKFVVTPSSEKILKALESLLNLDYVEGSDHHAVITGETGSGKTALIKHFQNQYPVVMHDDYIEIPIVYVSLQSVKTVVEFAESTLKAIRDPQGARGIKNFNGMMTRMRTLIKTCRVRMIIFDETQVPVQNNHVVKLPTIADWFKDLMIELKIPVVLVGMPWVLDFIEYNSQLSSRISYRFNISHYKVSRNFQNFRLVMRKFSQEYDLYPVIDLSSIDWSLRLYSYSKGSMRAASSLLALCFSEKKNWNDKILKSELSKLLDLKGIPKSKNHFLVEIKSLQFKEIHHTTCWSFEEKPYKVKMKPPVYKSYVYKNGGFVSYG